MKSDPHGSGELFPWEEVEPQAAAAAAETAPMRIDEPAQDVAPPEDGWDTEADAHDDMPDVDMPLPSRPVVPKEYYSISEVCDLVDLKPHVLRYWETQFPVLNPSKNRSGNRVYQRKEIRLILLVKHLLYDEKYTVEGARAKLDQLRRGGTLHESTRHALEPQMIELLRGELHQLHRILAPQGAGPA